MIDATRIIVYHSDQAPARWQSGYAAVCKTVYIGSIPVRASSASMPPLIPSLPCQVLSIFLVLMRIGLNITAIA